MDRVLPAGDFDGTARGWHGVLVGCGLWDRRLRPEADRRQRRQPQPHRAAHRELGEPRCQHVLRLGLHRAPLGGRLDRDHEHDPRRLPEPTALGFRWRGPDSGRRTGCRNKPYQRLQPFNRRLRHRPGRERRHCHPPVRKRGRRSGPAGDQDPRMGDCHANRAARGGLPCRRSRLPQRRRLGGQLEARLPEGHCPGRSPGRPAQQRPDRGVRRSPTAAVSQSLAEPHTDAHSDTDAHPNPDAYSDPDPDSDSNTHTYSDPDDKSGRSDHDNRRGEHDRGQRRVKLRRHLRSKRRRGDHPAVRPCLRSRTDQQPRPATGIHGLQQLPLFERLLVTDREHAGGRFRGLPRFARVGDDPRFDPLRLRGAPGRDDLSAGRPPVGELDDPLPEGPGVLRAADHNVERESHTRQRGGRVHRPLPLPELERHLRRGGI